MRRQRTPTLALLLAAAAAPANAQPAYQVGDLGDSIPYEYSIYIGPFAEHVTAGGKHYFYQDDGVHGRELWRTDGTPLGTFMVRDLCPGSCGSRTLLFGAMAPLGDRLVFAANDGTHGVELWITDGTALGTTLVADLRPGYASSQLRTLTSAGDQVFFVAQGDGPHTTLWRTDGTTKGTYAITPPGPAGTFAPTSIHPGPGFLYLCNASWSGQAGLWRSDGTAPGTELVAAVECWLNSLGKWSPISVGPSGVLFFHGSPLGSNDEELWRSDGTAAGTYLLKELVTGPQGGQPTNLAWRGSELIFWADSDSGRTLWRSDGTTPGTTPIPLSDDAEPWLGRGEWAVAGDRFFFAAFDWDFGTEPWVYDGISATRIADLRPGPDSSIEFDEWSFSASLFEPFGDDVLFAASDGIWGREIWRSDGTAGGTARLSDIAPGAAGLRFPLYWPNYLSSLGGRLLFAEHQNATGDRLWRVDASGTALEMVDTLRSQASLFEPRTVDRFAYFYAEHSDDCFQGAGAHLFLERIDKEASTVDLLRTDGALSGPEEILTDTLWQPAGCGRQGDRLLYSRSLEPAPQQDWELIGLHAPSGASELLLATGGLPTARPPYLDAGDHQLFVAGGGLWATDGTASGTTNLLESAGDGRIDRFEDEIVFAGQSLWITDSDFPGTLNLLLEGDFTDLHVESEIAPLPKLFLIAVTTPALGTEIWASDGTVNGTGLLVDANPGPASLVRTLSIDTYAEQREPKLVSGGDYAVFAGETSPHGAEIWVSDGTALGTHLLKDIHPGDYPSTPRNLIRFGNRVFFTAESELEGLELWATDGTYEGTVLLKDIAPGAASSLPDDLVVRDGVLYFSAWSPNYGREAWKSDGTSAGTIRITDIAPGPKSSSPQRFARAGSRLYFSATDHVHGYELWAISDDGSIPLFLDGFESGGSERWSSVDFDGFGRATL